MNVQSLHFVRKSTYTKVSKDKVVQLKYALFDNDDRILEYRDDLTYLHGGYGGAFPKIEKSLEGLEIGMKCEVKLTPQEGFGVFNPFLVITEPLTHLPPEAEQIGMLLDGESPTGEVVKFMVTKVENGMVTVDGNHPYAGKTVKFVFEVADIRSATPKELELGSALKKKSQLI